MEKSLEGKVTVITGASRGIGRAIALRFAQAGAHVVLLARRKAPLADLRELLLKQNARATTFPVDLADPAQLQNTFYAIRKNVGHPHVLVNNAGMGFFSRELADASLEDYEQTFNLNVRALFLATKEVLPAMIEAKEGTIINIASVAGKIGLPKAALYCASKFAVVGLSEALLEEIRSKNIRVSTICPGMVHTDFFGREHPFPDRAADMIQPEDVAEAAFLCATETQTATFKEIVIRPRKPIK